MDAVRRTAIVVALVLSTVPAASHAQVVTYLFEGEPAFSLEYPPGWEVRTPLDADKPLLSAVPRDGSLLWHGVWIVNASTRAEAEERLKALGGRLFKNVEFPGEPWTETYGDLEIRCIAGRGTYQDERSVALFLGVFQVADERLGAFIYMGEPQAVAVHEEEMRAMLASLEVAK